MLALNENERQELTRLRIKVAELEDTLREYERPEAGETRRALAQALKASIQLRPNSAHILAELILTAPRIRSSQDILASRLNIYAEDGSYHLAHVEVCFIRSRLKAKNLPIPETMHGQGWYLTRSNAAIIRGFAERHG